MGQALSTWPWSCARQQHSPDPSKSTTHGFCPCRAKAAKDLRVLCKKAALLTIKALNALVALQSQREPGDVLRDPKGEQDSQLGPRLAAARVGVWVSRPNYPAGLRLAER